MKKTSLRTLCILIAAAVCAAFGLTACGEANYSVGDAHKHIWSDWTVSETNEPNEETTGIATRTCNGVGNCNAKASDREYILPALNEVDYTVGDDTATCSAEGKIAYTYNKDGVNVSFEKATPINAEAHKYGEYVKAEKESEGHIKICEYNGEHKTAVAPHDTKGAGGACSECGYKPSTENPTVHAHTPGGWINFDPKQHYKLCSDDDCPDPDEKLESAAHDTKGAGGACSVCGYLKRDDMLTPTSRTVVVTVGGDESATIYGYTVSNTYHTYTYVGEKPITISYRYYVLGDKDENGNDVERTGEVTLSRNGQRSFTVYLQTQATCTMKISSDEDEAFEAEIKLTRVGSEDPDVEHAFTLGTLASVDTNYDGKKYTFTAQEDKWYVLTCDNVNARVLLTKDSDDDEAVTLPYTFHLDAGAKIVFLMCTVEADATYDAMIAKLSVVQCLSIFKSHSLSETEVIEHTCTDDGYTLFTCDRCGYTTKDSYIPAAHSYGDWVITTDATCTDEGERTKTCSECGDKVVETIDAKGHNTKDVEWTIVEATCIKAGSKKLICKDCEKVVKSEVIPINDNHDYGDWVKTDPEGHYKVCKLDEEHTTEIVEHDTDGEHGSCTVCGYMPKHVHAWSAWTVTDDNKPTETKTGKATRTCTSDVGECKATSANKEYVLPELTSEDYTQSADTATCSATGKITYTYNKNGVNVSFDVATAKNDNHDYGDYTYTDGTGHYMVCSRDDSHTSEVEDHDEDGEHHSCSVCGYMPEHTHTWSEWKVTTANKPTELRTGKATRTCTSDVGECKATTADKERTLPVLTSEDYTKTADTATCIAAGKVTYTYNKDGVNVSFDVATDINDNHDYGDWVKTDPAGHYKICKLDEEHTTEKVEHNTNGEHSSCTVCGYMPKHVHTWSAWTVVDGNKPTKDATGKATRTCTSDVGECKATAADKERTLPALTSSDYSKTADTATCSTTGKITYTYNKNGVNVSFDVATLTNDNHDYGDYTYTDGTGHYMVCSRDDSHTSEVEAHDTNGEHGSCTVCGYMSPHTHSWSTWTVTDDNKPTETKTGKATRTCTSDVGVCNATTANKERALPVLTSEDYTKTADTATCSATGKITYTYNKNGVNVSFDVATAKNDNHDYVDYTYTDGTGHYKVCSYDHDHTTEVEDHDEDGEHHSCSVCGYMPEHTHTWSEWKVTTANKPTELKTGKATRTCTSDVGECKATTADKEYVLPVLTSSDYTKTADTATCIAAGKVTYTYNKDGVNVSFDVATPINASNHDYGDYTYTDGTGHYKVCSYDHDHTTEVEVHNTDGEHSSCTVCGYMPKHVHAWSAWTVTDGNKPTKDATGKATRTCTSDVGECKATTADKERTLPVLTSSDYTKTSDTATCSATGKITYTYNKNSVNVSFDVATPINASKHNYGDYTYTDGTGHYKVCSYDSSHTTTVEAHDEDGEHHSCSVCGYMPAHTHTWSAWTVTTANKPTETKTGKATRTCTSDVGVCKATVADKEYDLPVLTSSDYTKTADTATCSATGKITYTYNKNGVNVSFNVTTPINDNHDYVDEYTYTDGTGHYRECSHDSSHTTAVEAHNMAGNNGKCSVCGYVWPNMITTAATEATVNVGVGKSATVYGYAPSANYYTYTYKGEKAITVSYSYMKNGTETTGSVTLSRDGRRSFTVQLAAKGVCTMSVTSAETTAFAATIKLTYNGSINPDREETFTLDVEATVNTTYDGVKYKFTAQTADWYVLTCGNNARVLLTNSDGTKQAVTLPYAFSLAANETVTFIMCSVGDNATYSAQIAKLNPAQCESIFGSHSYLHKVTAPTCSAQGYTTHTCERCGDSYSDNNTEKLEHEYNWNITVEATCTRLGKKSGTCKNCGHEVIDQEIPMKAHSTQGAEWQTVREANCDEEGLEKLCCTVCNNIVQTREIAINPNAHSYVVTVTKKPTFTEKGTAQLICNHNEGHTSTVVTLPMLTSSQYNVTENDQFRTYKIQTDIGEASFSIELEEIKTISKAIEYAVNTGSMIVDSTIDMSLNAVQGGGGGTITYEFGDNYIHAKDGYMKTERWITLKEDGTFFALIEKEDRNDQIHIMLDDSVCMDDFKGYAFRLAYAQQEWEMSAVYGLAQYVDVLYKFASQNGNSKNFTQSITTKNGKTYYTFSYAFVDADPHENTDMNHSISVEFTLNDDYFMDYCKIVGQSNRGKSIGSGELLATQTYAVTQHSRRGIGEQAPVNPYDEQTIALTNYRLRYIESVDEALENIVLGDGYFPIDGENNSLGTIGYGKTYQLKLVEYTPTEGVNFRYDVIKFYLRKHGETGLGELLDGSYEDNEGHVLASFDPISMIVSLGFYRAGEYDLILKTVKTEKVVHFNIPFENPDKINAYVYNEFAGEDESPWQSDKSEFEIVTGYTVTFYGRVPHPGKQYSEYTVTVKKDGSVVNGVLTTTETDGKTVYVFTPNAVGSYTITLDTTHGNCTKTLSVLVLDAPDADYLKGGRFANDFKEISVNFDSSQSRFTLNVGNTTSVYSYTLSGTTFSVTLVSGTHTEFGMYFNSARELIYEKDGEKAVLFKDGEANAIVGAWDMPTAFKVNVTGEYVFSFSKYIKSGESIIGCSIDGEDYFAVLQPLTLALKSGQNIIFATIEKEITVTVVMCVAVTEITLNKTEETLFIDGAVSLVATIKPSDATNTMKTWTSSNESVATVTSSGYVVAKGVGTAIITVTAADGVHSATCTIKVLSRAVTGVTLSETSHTMFVDEAAFTLTATITPDYAENKNVTWTSSNPAAATVDENGVVTPVGVGTTTITVATVDGGKTATCVVTVNRRPVTGVTLDKTSHSMIVGDTLTLTATVEPVNATNKAVTWSTSNANVAKVVNGVVTAVGEGNATITVTTADGNKTATCVVTVNRIPVTGVSLDVTSHQMYMNDTLTLTATVAPENATYKTVTWTSSNPAVVKVEDGVVTPVGAGTAIITVTTDDGSKTATCEVTVLGVELTGVSIAPTTLSLVVRETADITATLTPANASYVSKSWTSSAPSVATVDNNGKVTAVGAGNATITFTVVTATATFSKTCDVSVSTVAVTGVTLDKTSHTLNKGETFTLTATVAPENATNKNVTWGTSNANVATVVDGVVTAIGNGIANITVTTADGNKTATCAVTVNVPVTGVTLDKTTHTMNKNDTLTLTATVEPSDATNKNVNWSTSNANVATVVNGVVTAVGKGDATITVTTADGGFTATCAVTVKVPITGVTLSATEKEITLGETFTLSAMINPSDADYDSISWTSSAPSVATVDNNGKVTAVSKGEATITCMVVGVGGTFTADCDVTAILAHYGAGEHALSYATVTSFTFVLDGEVGAPYNISVYYGGYRAYIYNYFFVNGEQVGNGSSFNMVLENANTEITVQKTTSGLTDTPLKLVICKTRIAVGEALNLGAVSTSDMTIKLSGCVVGKEYKVTALQSGEECNSINIVIESLGSYYNYGNATFTYADGVELKIKSAASSGLAGITLMLQEVVHVVIEHTSAHQLNYTSNGVDKHTVICSVAGCNYEVHDEDHVYDDDSDDTCNLCGYKRVIPVDHTDDHQLTYISNNSYDHTVSCSVNGCTYDVHTEVHVYDDDDDTTCNLCGYTREIVGGTVTIAVGGQVMLASLDWSGVAVQLSGCVEGKEYKVTALLNDAICNDVSITVPAVGIYFGYYGEVTFTYVNGVSVNLSSPSGKLTNITVALTEVGGGSEGGDEGDDDDGTVADIELGIAFSTQEVNKEFIFKGEANKKYHIEIIPNGWPTFSAVVNGTYHSCEDDWNTFKSYYKGDVFSDGKGKLVIKIESLDESVTYTITITEA